MHDTQKKVDNYTKSAIQMQLSAIQYHTLFNVEHALRYLAKLWLSKTAQATSQACHKDI